LGNQPEAGKGEPLCVFLLLLPLVNLPTPDAKKGAYKGARNENYSQGF